MDLPTKEQGAMLIAKYGTHKVIRALVLVQLAEDYEIRRKTLVRRIALIITLTLLLTL